MDLSMTMNLIRNYSIGSEIIDKDTISVSDVLIFS